MMRFSGKISAALWICIIIALAAATIAEKYYGSAAAQTFFYNSAWFISLWTVATFFSVLYSFHRKIRRLSVICMHISLIVILAGALCTKLFGESGQIILQKGMPPRITGIEIPFEMSLDTFYVAYYAGTNTPSDYVSRFTIYDRKAQQTENGQVSMNKVFPYRNYRFCQSSFSDNKNASVLSINRDLIGIAVTYAGYILFALSGFVAVFKRWFVKRKKIAAVIISLLFLPCIVQGANDAQKVPVVSGQIAEKFGGLYILYNGRITSVSVFAHDFCIKLTGKGKIGGVSSEQFLMCFLFYPEEWQRAAIFEIKDPALKKLLNAEYQKASAADFFDSDNNYKLAAVRKTKEVSKLNDRIQAINLLHSGSLLPIFPLPLPSYANTDINSLHWYYPTENMPLLERQENITFVRTSLTQIYSALHGGSEAEVIAAIDSIKKFQLQNAGEFLPSDIRIKTEVYYQKYSIVPLLFKLNLFFGILLLLLTFIFRNKRWLVYVQKIIFAYSIIIFCLLTLFICARIYISGHLPFAAGYEIMLFMAWISLIAAILFRNRAASGLPLLPFCLIVSGFAMLVAHLSGGSPKITPLVPVLSSPLLSIHVSIIMISYALLSFTALNSLAVLLSCIFWRSKNSEKNTLVFFSAENTMQCLRPAVFLLGAGIFVGAVWANISWGSYWSWDPKETWALITFISYALILHIRIKRRILFHAVVLLAFLSVLITYFGVNYFFGGMHSYA